MIYTMDIQKSIFGQNAAGRNVEAYTLTNKNELKAVVLNYGAIIQQLRVPDRKGNIQDIVLGYESMTGYLTDPYYMGSIVGRYGNRIAGGRFTLDGHIYKLACNNGPNHLHGGLKGFNQKLFEAETLVKGPSSTLRLTYSSADAEEGYPGNLRVTVDYTLADTDELSVEYSAATDKKTVLNLTNHSYFNLSGDFSRDILKHELLIKADRFTPTDSGSIPTGEILAVKGTPLDFTDSTAIEKRINDNYPQMIFAHGYDQNFVLNKKEGELALAARVYEAESGRLMEILTSEPAIQLYSGNFLDATRTGKEGKIIQRRGGFCLEPQHFPDSPNQPGFPSTVLDPGKRYNSKTIYHFSTKT
jgi:aldose 1-epimerase